MRCSRPLIPASVVVVAALSLLAAGCGSGSSPGVANIATSTTGATTTTQNGTTTTRNGTLASALAFARCMRSHGIPGWPDPDSSGHFDKSKLRALPLSVSRVQALEEGPCNIPLPQPQSQTIPPADQADYLRAAACIRSHGFPTFPDPTFPNNTIELHVPSTINRDSSRFKSAATICTRLVPAGLPYSRPSTP